MVEPHRHCAVCNTPVPLDKIVCSSKCEHIYNERKKKVRQTRIGLYVIFAVFVILWIVLYIL